MTATISTPTIGLESGRQSTVQTPDGVELAVTEYGPSHAAVTVVLLHGHCLRKESWAGVRHELFRQFGREVRVVSYDHRGHGRSGEADVSSYTIDQLGTDLVTVIDTVVPTGMILIAGHSMGGMAAISFAVRMPARLQARIVGLGLIATAAGELSQHGLGRMLNSRTLGAFQRFVDRAPRAAHAVRRGARRTLGRGQGRALHGWRGALSAAVNNESALPTVSGFLSALRTFNEIGALSGITIPTAVVCGTEDQMTPIAHSQRLAGAIATAQLTSLQGAGHSVVLEAPRAVARALAPLVDAALQTSQAREAIAA